MKVTLPAGFLLLVTTLPLMAEPPAGYKLAWSDEFDGSTLDTTLWAYREDNKHRSVQRRENVRVNEGRLTLDLLVHEERIDGKRASGAGVVTRERFRHGYYETRARLGLPGGSQRGWHHAFWAMAAEVDERGAVATTYPGVRRTEIDGYENSTDHRGAPSESGLSRFTQHVIVWAPSGREVGRLPKPPADITALKDFDAGVWHKYAFCWTPQRVEFFVDGQPTCVAEYPESDFEHDAVNVWLTAISANWNTPDATPSRAEYDYLRVYAPRE